MSLYRLDAPKEDLVSPTLISALDGWVDSGTAATSAATQLAGEGPVVATFDGDVLFDYRARRPTLDIVDGRLAELTWPELTIRHARLGERDLLVLTGAEPDFRWREFADAVVELVGRLGVTEWISLGAIPAAVPHTRSVPIMGTESEPGLLRADVQPGPKGVLRVPSAALSVLEMTLAKAGTPAVGYFAQIPHYVSGPYPVATLALLRAVESHLGVEIPTGGLDEEARQLRTRLDLATGADEATRAYVERLETMVDEERLPAGDELISEIERFLRDRGAPGGPGTLPN
ncbi:MAG: PAC2 family protein [Chloroflexota bacterium]|nr:PAC2 family protein [Chloroflexota bacterium]